MTHPILFRAKVLRPDPMTSPESGWVEGFYYQDLCNGEMRHFIKNCPCDWEIDPKSLGQATGLLDRKGAMIFEGDIIRQRGYGGMKPCAVKFEAGAFIVGWHGGSSTLTKPMLVQKNGLVIGNIHDNPELLNPTKP